MVRDAIGRTFSLTLTNASTGEERREYVDAMGTTWVEGEKGDEYFIMLKNQDVRDVVCKIFVDDQDLGYSYAVPSLGQSQPFGVLKSGQSVSDSNLISHALKFVEKPRTPAVDEDDEDGRLPSSGSVRVEWYQCTWVLKSIKSDTSQTTSSWSGSRASSSTMHKKEQSQLRSEEGSTASTLSTNTAGRVGRAGQLYAVTTVMYTSNFGLAVRGLLSADETGMITKRQKTVVID